ncbi:flagellar hook-basal body protein [Oribacterium sinus]|jgi:fagellar hook-basal body proteins|uniref:Flagellar hook-basal body protein n=3 Tax=Oribacterium TaxID=265975 RepID=C2KYY8_9FIRM|nr:flagellar hook-basal body complex protein [Oribacterium sinus]EEJ50998.1 flagellar hook-basal body protein [Oribacterium sinus F0268]MBB6040690.1 flagellar basal-body rod protein FlgG [Oribacterium sinus]MBF1284552.1 flagellar hook-basal body complex protein [Oribacterium parvum]
MNMSFYVGALGADASQKKMGVISNNLANINNTAFKPKNAIFSDLINYNLNDSPEAKTDLQAEAGTAVVRTNTEYSPAAFHTTGQPNDYAIGNANAFFKLQDPSSGEITYTRNGHFHAGEMPDGKFYLFTESGKHVLDENGKKMLADDTALKAIEAAGQTGGNTANANNATEEVKQKIGVYTINYPSRLVNKGDNELAIRPGDQNNKDSVIQNPILESGTLESSGTDMAKEMTRLIESQRAFTYALKMVQTSDEVEGTINQLRG